jgi:hypothetical protein
VHLNPPKELLTLPYTSNQEDKAELFVSVLLKPVVSPAVPGLSKEKKMEIRFFAQGKFSKYLRLCRVNFWKMQVTLLTGNDSALDMKAGQVTRVV